MKKTLLLTICLTGIITSSITKAREVPGDFEIISQAIEATVTEDFTSTAAPNTPESIIYDSSHQRYLISNHADGQNGSIIAYDPAEDKYSYFNQAHTEGPKGLAIFEDVLYVSDRGFVNGFDLETGQRVFHVNVSDFWINDLAVDTSGFLYLGDRNKEIIYKIDTRNGNVEEWVSGNLEEINGLVVDIENNRIVACFSRTNSPIMEFDLASGAASTILETNYSVCDGITTDNCGNFYVACHVSRAIIKFDKDFSQAPEVYLDNLTTPGDIFFNPETHVLCIPELETDRILFVDVFQTCFPPILNYPEDKQEEVSSKSPCFSWNEVYKASYYRFEIATDHDFINMLVVDGTENPEYTVDNLQTNTTYYWRVSAYTQNEHTVYSETRSFKTELTSSAKHKNYSPSIKLFPNPGSGEITVSWERSAPIAIRVISQTGQLVHQQIPASSSASTYTKLQLKHLLAGTYYLVLVMHDMHRVLKKIVIL
ncbi:MAG: SMP-30/gluconolactonase/LRE family protein [Bacteroidota bacterium]|nr:SMP-30/gluconolactonase/LRE family protein [Bacteroidota bacterium]